MRLLVKSINGIAAYDPVTRQPNADYFNVLDAFKALQDEEALGVQHENHDDGVRTYVYLRDVETNPVIESAVLLITEKLRLNPEAEDVEVVFGPYYHSPDVISLQTMSVMDILIESAAYIEVPEAHVAEGRTEPNRVASSAGYRPLVRIRSAEKRPPTAPVAIQDRDHWYYIDDRDFGPRLQGP